MVYLVFSEKLEYRLCECIAEGLFVLFQGQCQVSVCINMFLRKWLRCFREEEDPVQKEMREIISTLSHDHPKTVSLSPFLSSYPA